jgi:hypothetical protein
MSERPTTADCKAWKVSCEGVLKGTGSAIGKHEAAR